MQDFLQGTIAEELLVVVFQFCFLVLSDRRVVGKKTVDGFRADCAFFLFFFTCHVVDEGVSVDSELRLQR